MLQSIGQHTERKSLDRSKRLSASWPISHHPREGRHLTDPASVFFLLQLDFERTLGSHTPP